MILIRIPAGLYQKKQQKNTHFDQHACKSGFSTVTGPVSNLSFFTQVYDNAFFEIMSYDYE